ncbi:MAG TPA: Z1 domain-containing protein [Solirubrobacteraceae bacterium]|nr:Z1 domain-containing protein [Solirubrobacteraceae bacterium]
MNFEDALGLARAAMRLANLDPEAAVESQPLIPPEMRDAVREALEREAQAHAAIRIADLRMLEDARDHHEWLRDISRQDWVYWPRLRQLLISRGWLPPVVQSIDDATDRILGSLESPEGNRPIDRRGLVVGYVQSGKTANYAALIAKAADTGYRLFIVLTGIHNQLRQQTQRRLNAELVGSEPGGVSPPTDERRTWLTFKTTDLNGDFNAGHVNTAALAGGQPALIVAKKNAPVLRRLNAWLDDLPSATRETLPVLIIDDEADQASPNTRSNRPFPAPDDESDDPEVAESPPSRINELIRRLLNGFPRVAYVGYTATPFANVLIDHQAEDREVGADIYPRSFIVDLPKPPDYYGPERIFGTGDDADSRGMDVIRRVPDDDLDLLIPHGRDEAQDFAPEIPESLRDAIDAFVLAGAARHQRGDGDEPATMLIHTTHYTRVQDRLHEVVSEYMIDLRDEWRYNWEQELEARLRARWEIDFRPVTQSENAVADVDFEAIRPHIGTLLEHPIETVQLNSASEDILDYSRDTTLKVIVVGGNRLSRGLTLEGLLVSYYVRRANAYDTLMQMGRWFGYRTNYADLTRIYTTADLEQWFRDLVQVEEDVRLEIRRYAEQGLNPLDFGVRIRRHPALLVTDRLKMRAAQVESMSFAGQLQQTVVFPLSDRDWLEANIDATRRFLTSLGAPDERGAQPMWRDVHWHRIVEFLGSYQTDPAAARFNPQVVDLLLNFLRRQAEQDELVSWVVGVMGQERRADRLGAIDLGVEATPEINLIERTRLRDTTSLGVITSPTHLGLGLSPEQIDTARTGSGAPSGKRLREVRDRAEGLLLVYPISRFSGWDGEQNVARNESREPIYPDARQAAEMADIIGIAIAMPPSSNAATVEYVVGTVGVGET